MEITMSKFVKSGLVFALVFTFCAVSLEYGAIKKKDRKRDGTCVTAVSEKSAFTIAAIKARTKDKKRDGSCLLAAAQDSSVAIAAIKAKAKDRKRDGSCLV